MARLLSVLSIALPVLYGGILVAYIRHFFDDEAGERFWGSGVLYGVLAVHAAYLVVLGVETGHFPIASKSEFFSLLALSVGTTYAFAERRHREANTGLFFVALVFVFQLASSWMTGDPGVVPARSSNPLYGTHVILIVFGFAGLTVSALYALMYLMLNRQLKSRQLGLIFRQLPALNVIEKMSGLATTTGVVLLGLGLVLGHYLAVAEYGGLAMLTHPMIIVADVFWIGYLVGLVAARSRALSGVRAGYLSVGAYVLFMSSMVVVLTQFGTFHTFS